MLRRAHDNARILQCIVPHDSPSPRPSGTRPDALLPSEFALLDVRLQVVNPPTCDGAQSWEAKVGPAPHWLTPALLATALEEATHVDRLVVEHISHSTAEEQATADFNVCDDDVFSQSHHLDHAEQAAGGRGVLLLVERFGAVSPGAGHRSLEESCAAESEADCSVMSDGACLCELRAELTWKSKPAFLEFILAWREP